MGQPQVDPGGRVARETVETHGRGLPLDDVESAGTEVDDDPRPVLDGLGSDDVAVDDEVEDGGLWPHRGAVHLEEGGEDVELQGGGVGGQLEADPGGHAGHHVEGGVSSLGLGPGWEASGADAAVAAEQVLGAPERGQELLEPVSHNSAYSSQ